MNPCSSHQALLEHCECQCACLFHLKGCMGYAPLTHYMTHYACSNLQLYFITNSVVRSPHLSVCLIGFIMDIVYIVLRWLDKKPGLQSDVWTRKLYFITNSVVRSPHLSVCLIGFIIDIVCIVLRWLDKKPGLQSDCDCIRITIVQTSESEVCVVGLSPPKEMMSGQETWLATTRDKQMQMKAKRK
jgi:hypothetical protein